MKTLKFCSGLVGALCSLLLMFPEGRIYAQFPHSQNSFGERRYNPDRFILLEPKVNPKLFKIAEDQVRRVALDGDASLSPAKITRIRGDSIYFDRKGYRFSQVKAIFFKYGLHEPIMYQKSDSARWKLFFPPDSVYTSRFTLTEYLRNVNRMKKHDRFEWFAPAFRPNMIKLNFSRIANLEIALSYERRINKQWSFEIETGYQFSGGNNHGDDGPMGLYPLFKYSGVSVNTGPKYYFNSRGYLQPQIHYRYLVMDNARSKFPGESSYLLQDQFRNDAGISFRIGQLIRLGDMIIDGYFGLGIKAMFIRQYAYGFYYYDDSDSFRWYNDQHTPVTEDMIRLYPIIGLGVKIGAGF